MIKAYLMPHPPIIEPSVGKGRERDAHTTVDAMRRVASEIEAFAPSTIVVVTPHAGLRSGALPIYEGALSGDFTAFGSSKSLRVTPAEGLRARLKATLDLYGVSVEPVKGALDHGVMVPLSFIEPSLTRARVLALGQFGSDFEDNATIATFLRSVLLSDPSHTALIISGDLSHKLLESGPYGYDPRGPQFDGGVTRAIETGDLASLGRLDPSIVKHAGECGYRGLGMLKGVLSTYARSVTLHSYEGPFGVGYAVASFNLKDEASVPALARRAIETRMLSENGEMADHPQAEAVQGDAPCFVTLKKNGHLRGCIGTIQKTGESLRKNIIASARAAAFEDPRFSPLSQGELREITLSVDVLGEPRRIEDLCTQDPSIHGLIVKSGARSGVLLPGITGIDTAQKQWEAVLKKAEISPGEPLIMERFEVVHYSE